MGGKTAPAKTNVKPIPCHISYIFGFFSFLNMVIWGHRGGLLGDIPGDVSPGNPPALLLHTQHNITMLSTPGESIPKSPAHRAKERPWELPAAPWALGEQLCRKGLQLSTQDFPQDKMPFLFFFFPSSLS